MIRNENMIRARIKKMQDKISDAQAAYCSGQLNADDAIKQKDAMIAAMDEVKDLNIELETLPESLRAPQKKQRMGKLDKNAVVKPVVNTNPVSE